MSDRPTLRGQSLSGSQTRFSRRGFLKAAAAIPFAGAFGPLTSRFLPAGQKPPLTSPNFPNSRAFDFSSLNSWITPADQFYLRSHFGVLRTDPAQWTLSIRGEVNHKLEYRLEELRGLLARELVVTLECAGNLVGWGGVSNARWKGVKLKHLLESAGVAKNAVEVVLSGADGGVDREAGDLRVDSFARAIPISKALDADTLLVYEMNGQPLPREHGGPVRALVPGYYAMDSVKWLRTITVTRTPFSGFYQTRRYYEARRSPDGGVVKGPLHTMGVKSQFARPIRGAVLKPGPGQGQVQLAGAAWSGSAEIEKVLISTDGGRHWNPAVLGPDHARYAWRLWTFEWTPPRPGEYELVARAIDSAGNEQPLYRDPSILTPYENNWADRRAIRFS